MSYNFSQVMVLVVESSPEMFKLFKNVLSMLDIPSRNVYSAYSSEEGYTKFCKGKYDLVITDWLENPDTGIELIKKIRQSVDSPNNFVPIIMTAGSGHLSRVIKSRDSGVSEYLVKPFSAETLAIRITRVIEHPKPFVISKSYTGPERRVRVVEFKGSDRRKEKQEIEIG